MSRPKDRVIIAVAGDGAAELAAGADTAGRVTIYDLNLVPRGDLTALERLAQVLVHGEAGTGTLSVVISCDLTALRVLVHHGAHAVVCPTAPHLDLVDGYVDPHWVWERHAEVGAALNAEAQRYMESGLASTWRPLAAL
ncbi:hypothetical protein [Deinococcus arenicola]|uniref:Uncharacterized protein n=1 Tax=Deinococcus arenicola TaxID=2994950 RepID=A0ABU4DVG6_9DEIO|nr:hypothetical protein [Deinococcus sp. ZS9-10]MDV6376443.1 hypothetical protein [Deinococcus sp. ZS9-10]